MTLMQAFDDIDADWFLPNVLRSEKGSDFSVPSQQEVV